MSIPPTTQRSNNQIVLPRTEIDLGIVPLKPALQHIRPQPAAMHQLVPKPLTLHGLLSGLRRRWRQAVVVGSILGACTAIFVWMFLPSAKPHAFIKLYYPAQQSIGLVNEHPDAPLNQQTQKELVLSRSVLRNVVEKPNVQELELIKEKGDAISWLAQNLAIDFPTGSEIMRITLTNELAEDAKIIVEEVAKSYIHQIANSATAMRDRRRERLQESLISATTLYNNALAEQRKKVDVVGVRTPETLAMTQRMALEELDLGKKDLTKIEGEIKRLRDLENSLSTRLARTPNEVTVAEFESVFSVDDDVKDLKKQRSSKLSQYNQKKLGLIETHPEMMQIQRDIKGIDTALEQKREELRTVISARIVEKLQADLLKTREDLAKAKTEEKGIQETIVRREEKIKQLNDATLSVDGTGGDLQAKATRVQFFNMALQKLNDEYDAPIRVHLLEEQAIIVRVNDPSRRTKVAVIAAIAMFGFVLVVMAFLEFRARRLSNADEVVDDLGMQLVGAMPARPGRSNNASDIEWEAILNEAVDSTRTIFLHAANHRNVHVVMVTSAVGSEGKTSVATRLAASLARSGRKTLLIDADLRNPSVHAQAKIINSNGVCEFLRGEVRAANGIQASSVGNLWILPAGRCDRVAIQNLAQEEFGRLIAELRQSFDFILIDASPVLPVADALLVARHVDGVLFSLMRDVSQIDRVNAACRRLAAIEVPLLGAVMNGASTENFTESPNYHSPVMV